MTDSIDHMINKLHLLGDASENNYFRKVDAALIERLHAQAEPHSSASEQPSLFGKLLVAIDFSPASQRALDYASELTDRFNSSVFIVHVVHSDVLAARALERFGNKPYDKALDVEPGRLQGLVKEQCDNAYSALESIVPAMPCAQLRVLLGNPAKRIVETAQSESVDLILMGTQGRGGWAHFVVGSVAERVVRLAPCPVFTIKEKNDERDKQ